MAKKTLRIEQYDTVLFNANINPLGIPVSVKKAIADSIESIVKYPEIYYNNLKRSVATYTSSPEDTVILGNGSSDLIRLFAALMLPKKALLLTPCSTEYESVLTSYGCELCFHELKEEEEYDLNVMELIASLDSSIDMIIIGNPNNPTSRKITTDDMETLAAACEELGIFLLIDEMYIEFMDDWKDYSSIPLTKVYNNIAVMRSVSKFFAVPGIRLAYAIMNNPEQMEIINLTTTKNNISTLSAVAGTVMFNDNEYIEKSQEVIHTERSLVYAAMQTCKTIKLIKPEANYMLLKILKPDITSEDVYEHCRLKGVIIRKCDDIRGLGDKYIRFCFMNPKQNDLMVNTILEIV